MARKICHGDGKIRRTCREGREDPLPESARTRGKSVGGASVTDDAMLSMALHLRTRDQDLRLRDIASRPAITQGTKQSWHPSPAARLIKLREHDDSGTQPPAVMKP
ncbi:hypothetical protein [Nonomuraea roseola]|uniref:Uncharacterized protein n=1 Tax=Nonomuraea roseola TaxID=46179 RepID=A0ABV5Q485_9ACTN